MRCRSSERSLYVDQRRISRVMNLAEGSAIPIVCREDLNFWIHHDACWIIKRHAIAVADCDGITGDVDFPNHTNAFVLRVTTADDACLPVSQAIQRCLPIAFSDSADCRFSGLIPRHFISLRDVVMRSERLFLCFKRPEIPHGLILRFVSFICFSASEICGFP